MIMYRLEGLSPIEELLPASALIEEHKHPFDEVRTILAGEMIVNISGNKLLLRPGDRVIIPANTKHSYQIDDKSDCLSLCANRLY